MRKAYLTIDDSPSKHTDELVDFLVARNIPAILYVRGEFLEDERMFLKIVRAIKKGMLIGNHSYAHERISVIGYDAQVKQILKTQQLIDDAYAVAGKNQPIKTFRFPHMDRGTAGWIVDFDQADEIYRDHLKNLFWEGIRVETTEKPDINYFNLKDNLQDWLADEGFQILPTPGVTHPWFLNSEMNDAVDAMYTFSTSDWMLTPRHKGQHVYKTIDDLKAKIDSDPWLQKEDSAHIILAHDDREDSLEITTSLIDHFLKRGFEFLPFANRRNHD